MAHRYNLRKSLIIAASALTLMWAAPSAAETPTAFDDFVGEPSGTVLMRADELIYEQETGTVTARGHVEANYGNRILQADEVIYNERTGVVEAMGNVSITQPTGEVMIADSLVLSDSLGEGIIQSLVILLDEHTRLMADRATRSGGNRTELERAVFSPCEACADGGAPLWQITSFRVIHDQENQRITYRDARFEIYGVPVAYLPFFSHPDPTVDRQSGLLAPSMGSSSEVGEWIEIPYYFALDPTYDLTVAPRITTREGVVMKAEWRQRLISGQYLIEGSITNAERLDANNNSLGGNRLRGHVFSNGKFELADDWNWGFNLELASDDTYLKRYDIYNRDRLTNNVFVERYDGRDFASYNGYYFIGLRQRDAIGDTPIVPVLYESREIFERRVLDGTIGLNTNGLVLVRTDGSDTTRMSAELTWNRTQISDLGHVYTLFMSTRADLYYVQNVPIGPGQNNEDEVILRGLPMAAFEWRWPWVRQQGRVRQVIEPIIQVVVTPLGGNPDDIPNEDSSSFEFDETNLFSYNKFPGLDRWEEGPRLNAGVRLAAQTLGGGSATVVFGQSFRLRDDENFDAESGLENQRSDFVGRIDLRPGPYLDLIHRFRLDRDDLHFRRNEVALWAGTPDYNLELGYVRLADDQIATVLGSREEVTAETHLAISDDWSFMAGARRDLENSNMISSFAGLVYEDECTQLELSYRRRFTRDRDIEPSTALMLRIRLNHLGR